MKKVLLVFALFVVTAEAAETVSNQHNIDSVQEKQRILKAIGDCRIHGLEGKHSSRICLLKKMFLRPDLMGRLPKGANVMMLYGPTGTGKTRTAYGIAAEAKEEIPVIRIDSCYRIIFCKSTRKEIIKC